MVSEAPLPSNNPCALKLPATFISLPPAKTTPECNIEKSLTPLNEASRMVKAPDVVRLPQFNSIFELAEIVLLELSGKS